MFRRWLIVSSVLIVLTLGTVAAAQDNVPPPLGFGIDSERSVRYNVYNFEREQTTTIASALTPYYGGESSPQDISTPQPEIEVQSPVDPTVRFVRVLNAENNPDDNDYALYRVNTDGSRRFVAAHAKFPTASLFLSLYWSPNGQYFYLRVKNETTGKFTMHKYDLRNDQLQPMSANINGINFCQLDTAWCVTYEVAVEDIAHPPSLVYLLNRDDGSLRELGRSERSQVRVLWLASGEQFIYGLTQPENRISLRRYDVASHSDTLVGELDGEYLNPIFYSPDNRWLVTETYLGQSQGYGYVLTVFDLRQPSPQPITLTDHESGLSYSSAASPHWVDSDSLIYSTRKQSKGIIIYRVDLPDGAPQEIARFEPDVQFYDHDWSPDGRWLALATRHYVTPSRIYLVSLTGGGTSELPVDLPEEESICVGWFSQAEYDSGKANICDVYLGMG